MSNGSKKGGWGWLVWVVVLGAAGYGGWRWWSAQQNKTQLPTFRTATVSNGEITQMVTANGQIVPVRTVQVGSQVSGIIQEIMVDFNSPVKAGDIVAKIDPSTAQQGVERSEADLSNAEASVVLTKVTYDRAVALKKDNLIPNSDLEKAAADLQQAEAGKKMKLAALNSSKVDLERTTIYAPISGVVITRAVDVGQTVASSFNTPTLFTIANDLSKMQIEAAVSEADVGGVEQGQKVKFTVDAFPERTFDGVVKQVRYAATTNQNVVTYTTIVDVNNADLKLRPSMTANASIITGQRAQVLRIPNAALRYKPTEAAIFKDPTAKDAGTNNTMVAAGGAGGPPASEPPAGGPSREEMRKRFENATPEERAAMRERFGGGGGRGGPGGGGRGPRSESSGIKTVYIVADTNAPAGQQLAKSVKIKTGLSDGSFTEVLDGLKEGDLIISGSVGGSLTNATTRPASSPFGGQPMGGGMRR